MSTTLDLRNAARLFYGSTEAQRLYFGSSLIWQKSGAPAFNPEVGLTLTSSIAADATIPNATISRSENAVFAVDFVGLNGSAGGFIFEFGAVGRGAIVSFLPDGSFLVRCGTGGSGLSNNGVAYLLTTPTEAPAGNGTLVWQFSAPENNVRAWWSGVSLGSPVPSAPPGGDWTGGDPGAFMRPSSSSLAGNLANINPSNTSHSQLRYYRNQLVLS